MLSKTLRIIVCTCSFLYTFYVLCHFTYFLSKHIEYDKDDELELKERLSKTLWVLLVNAALLSAFMLQHSVMASTTLKNIYYKLNVEDIERSIYNASTSAVLHLLINNWQTIPGLSIWNFSKSQNNSLWIATSIVHVIGWCIVYSACIMMDISELAGLKQVYYKLSGRPSPMGLKSRELQKYYGNMRHPSFTGFLMILWIYPLMSLDRLVMASVLTVYMALMWTIDKDDYDYHSIIIARKEIELSNKNY